MYKIEDNNVAVLAISVDFYSKDFFSCLSSAYFVSTKCFLSNLLWSLSTLDTFSYV